MSAVGLGCVKTKMADLTILKTRMAGVDSNRDNFDASHALRKVVVILEKYRITITGTRVWHQVRILYLVDG